MIEPENLLYAKTHEWVQVETDAGGSRIATVGLSAFAVESLTDLVFIDLPPPCRRVAAGESLGEIESVKAVSDIYSPVDGEVVENNLPARQPQDSDDQYQQRVVKWLEQLTKDPYQAGWLVKIRFSDESALADLLDYKTYQQQCAKHD
jgi:glycine cleavage system H protein